MPLLLTNEDVVNVLSMPDCMAPMEQAFAELGRGEAVSRPRSDLVAPQPEAGRHYVLKTCDALLPGVGLAAVRVTSNMMQEFRDNKSRRLDPLPIASGGGYVGLLLLFDMHKLDLVAIIQDARIQVMRAGAAYGIATKYLARKNAEVMGIIGSGQQAREQLSSTALVRSLRQVKVYSPTLANRERFAKEMSNKLQLNIVPCDDIRSVMDGADIVAATTSALQPLFPGEWLQPGQHVSSVRVNEVDDLTRERASVLVLQSGEITSLLTPPGQELPNDSVWLQGRSRSPDPRRLALIPDIVVGRHPGRTDDKQITLVGGYATFGPATGYAALGVIAVERARQRGIGRQLPNEWFVQQESS